MAIKKQYDEDYKPWDGDCSKIPENETLVAIDTASSGLVNMIVSGYEITYYNNNPQIRIKVRSCCKDPHSNERMLEDLELPLTIREKVIYKDSR